MNITAWEPSAISTLTAMAAQGKTAREVANVLGFTRSAVLGKAKRLGVSFPLTEEKRSRMTAGCRGKRAPRAANWAGHRGRPRGSFVFSEKERLLAVAQYLAGLSANKAARSIGASAQSLSRHWMHDQALVAKARAIVERARQDARALVVKRLEERARQARVINAWNEGVLRSFSSRNAEIIRLRLAGRDLAAIARDFGITRERARQILMKGVKAGIKAPPGVRLLNDRVRCAA